MVADDQALIRESLKIILSAHPDIEVVATVEDGNHVLSSIPQTHPDLILMDIRMPGMDGVLATKEVKEHYPDIKIIILTTFDDDEFIYSALKYGASGYLLKGASTEELYEAIKVVHQGGAMINPNIASKVFQIFSQMAKTNFSIAVDEDNVKDLSTTEWRIIQEVGYGESNKEIAAKLFLSEGTVRNYLSTILAKLNLRDRTQLAIWSVQTGVTRRDFSKGNLDLIINSAGIYTNNRTTKLTDKEAYAMIDINLTGVLNTFEAVRDMMFKNNRGHIAIVSSVAGLLDYPKASVYARTKMTIMGVCETYRSFFRDYNINITTIVPGYIATDKLKSLSEEDITKKPTVLSEEESTNIIIKAIEEKKEKIIYPLSMKILISIITKLPKRLLTYILMKQANWGKK